MTLRADAPELEVVVWVTTALEEAERLLADHPEMAVVRAVSAFEVFLKDAFLGPYLQQGVFADNPELGTLVTSALLGDARRWRERVAPILKSCWRIEVETLLGWRDMGRAWRSRNEILHHRKEVDSQEAARHVDSCKNVTRSLLLAREAA